MTDDSKIFAIVTDQVQMRAAFAARRKQLGFSQLAFDNHCGFQEGYTAKLECGSRGFGQMSLETMLSGLKLKIVLASSTDQQFSLEVAPASNEFFVRRASAGGKARKEKTTFQQRSKWAKKANAMRWRRDRESRKAVKAVAKKATKRAAPDPEREPGRLAA